MNNRQQQIKDGLRKISHRTHPIVAGTVYSVDTDEYSMQIITDLNESGDETLTPVNLNAISGTGAGVILVPAINSDVVVADVQGNGVYVLVQASAVDQVITTIGTTKCTLNSDGFKLLHNGENFTQLMQDFLQVLAQMTFTNSGGTTMVPNNVADLNTIKTRLQNILT